MTLNTRQIKRLVVCCGLALMVAGCNDTPFSTVEEQNSIIEETYAGGRLGTTFNATASA